ncbi:hypothetical protein TNCV_4222111 [Trichonephila clavipes]|nr:hypothetical protein TNCV_4222111 [Trichonephila clavipes]
MLDESSPPIDSLAQLPIGDPFPPGPGTSINGFRIPKSNAQRGKVFRERKKKLAESPVKKVTSKKQGKKTQKNIANLLSATAESPSEYKRKYRAQKRNTAKYSLNAQFKRWECY